MNTDLRPLGVGEILDRSLKLYLSNFGKIIGTAAAVVLVALLVMGALGLLTAGLVVALGGFEGFLGGNPPIASIIVAVLGGGMVFVVYLAAAGVLQGALIHAVSDLYLGVPFEMKSVIRRAWTRSGAIIATWMLTGLGVLGGYMLCIIPGIIFLVAWTCSVPTLLLEGTGPTDAMRRSWHLTRGRRWEIFAVMFILWLVSSALSQLANCIGPSLGGAAGPETIAILIIVMSVSGMLVQLLVWPLYSFATTIIYYDLRVRKEAFDLQILAREVGSGESLS